MDLELDGNSALVLASSDGLGYAAAEAFAREGANVVINGRDEDRLAAAKADLEAIGSGEIVAHAGDVTDPETTNALVNRAVEAFGGLDHLVTNAGGPPSGAFLEIDEEAWYDAYELLVMSAVRTIRTAAPHLQDGGGTIVTITSRSVKEAIDSLVLSNAVRMSVIGLEKTLSKELGPDVRANAVLPGAHETARIRTLVEQAIDRGEYDSYAEGLAEWSTGVPLERIGDPIELGNTVAFLSSPASGYINGAAIPIDGGAGSSNL